MSFEVNRGQTDARVKFLARGSGYSLFLTHTEAVFSLSKIATQETGVLRMKLLGAAPSPHVVGLEELPGKSNYLLGNDPKRWRTNVAHYARVKYESVYPGVDVVYYGNQRQLEYDFILAPGADPSVIRLTFDGARTIEIDPHGDLVLHVKGGEVRQRKPLIYQEAGDSIREVAGRYVKKGNGQVGFDLGDYDPTRPLVIDPVLVYSTYLGGSGNDLIYGVAADGAGNTYVAGYTGSPDFPTTAGAFQTTSNGGDVAFVTKLDASGSELIYSTFLGGAGSNVDEAYAIAVDSAGRAYVAGTTHSPDFPTTAGAFDTSADVGGDAFVAKLSPSGSSLVYSTCLGGGSGDKVLALAIDGAGLAYVTGHTDSSTFPTTPGVFDSIYNGGREAFATKLNANGTALSYSTFLGGSANDIGRGIALDGSGNAYLTGETLSVNFPTTAGVFDTSRSPGTDNSDAFVTKLNPTGSALSYSTYLGGSWVEVGNDIAVDGAGHAYVTGYTTSQDFPVASGAFDPFPGGNHDAFVTKFAPTGSALIYSTYLGSGGLDIGYALALDEAGHAYVTGTTTSTDFPTTTDALDTSYASGTDTFVTKLAPTGSALVYSTYLGGGGDYDGAQNIAIDTAGNVYVAGLTKSLDLPTTPGSFDTSYNGGFFDAFITKLAGLVPTPTPTPAPCSSVVVHPQVVPAGTVGTPYSVTFTATGGGAPYTFAASGTLPAGLSLSSNTGQLAGTPTGVGTFNFTIVATDAGGCAGGAAYAVNVNPTPAPSSCNAALAANGATATASSQFGSPGHPSGYYPASGVNDGEHDGNNWGAGGAWNDATNEVFPDTVEVNFGGARTIQEIHVYTLKNQPNDGSAVGDSTPAGVYGIKSFTVEYHDGSAFQNVLGGAVTGNTLAKRRFVFPPVTTDRIRVIVHDSADHLFSRIVEVEAFTCTPGCPSATPAAGNWRVAFETNRDGNSEIYLADADGRNPVRLTNNPARDADPFFSPDGARIVFPSNRDGNYEIYVMNADGSNQTRLTANSVDDTRPAFSPDGTKIAFQRGGGNASEIWVMNSDGSNQLRITNNSSADMFPKWSPDGAKLIFHSDRDGDFEIYVMNADGSNVVKLTNNNSYDNEASFSPDGTRIVFASDRSGNTEVWVMNADGSQPVNLSNSSNTDGSCAWSADGSRVLFASARDGNSEVYAMNPDGTGQTRLTVNTALENTPVSGFVPRVNHASAANGASAAASSTLDAGRAAFAAINGDRRGIHWGTDPATGSGWHDATSNSYPDWLEVSFNGSKTITEVNVFTVQNNYTAPSEPTEAMTFSLYGIQDFDVEYWTGSAWAAVPGGQVTGNNLVWRKFVFPALSTSKIRLLVKKGASGYARITEVEAY